MAGPNNAPILYSFRRCPYAMRARLALYVSGVSVELREITLRDKPSHLLEISPKGTIPVLLLPDGSVIDESLDIMHWALGRQDPDEWLDEPHDGDHDNLIKRNDGPFKTALDRYKYPNRYPDEDCTGMFENAADILKDLNTRIKENGALTGKYSALADYAIFPFIRQFKNVDQDRFHTLNLKALDTWLERHLQSPLFNAIMEKYAPWQPNDAALYFGE